MRDLWFRILEALGLIPTFYVVEFDVSYYGVSWGWVTARGGAHLCDGCEDTGLFINKQDAARYQIRLDSKGMAPMPTRITRIKHTDPRIAQSIWRDV